MDVLKTLNSEQRRAVEAGEGPVVIVAGPGTGKTKTLTARIAYLIASGRARPGQILALTFTKKAAEEMKQRVTALLHGRQAPNIATFHGLCHELLGGDTPFVSEAQRLQIIKSLSRPKDLKSVSVRELGLMISRAKNQPTIDQPDMAKLVRAYNKALAEQNVRDFDDLLLQTYELLKGDDQKRQAVQDRYKYILVDEFQDTNRLQYKILRLLLGHMPVIPAFEPESSQNKESFNHWMPDQVRHDKRGAVGHDNVFVIGDPNQSIYGFRGASGTIFEQFKADFPGHTAVTLATNYRSVPEVVRLSNALFAGSAELQAHSQATGQVRAVQVLNEYSEAEWVLGQIQRAIGGGDLLRAVSDDTRAQHRRLNDFAVLYRSRPAATVFQKLLAESGLPYQVAGDGSPYDMPQIQAILSLLRAAMGHEDLKLEGFSAAQRRLIQQELADIAQAVPSALVERLIPILGFEPSGHLQQLTGVLARFKNVPSALEYFDHIAEQGFYDPAADTITLLTIHAAKGLEFPYVFVIGANEGILPSGRGDPEEERRLFYVAATRAKEHLEIVHVKNRGGQQATISSFITQLPAEILARHTDPAIDTQLRRIAKRAAKKSQTSLF